MRDLFRMALWISLAGVSFLAGCATPPQVDVKSEILDSSAARSHSVAVMSDFYMENPSAADRVADQVRQVLKDQGFKVGSSEMDADLIVVPTMAKSQPLDTPHAAANRPPLISSSFGQPGMTQGSGGFAGGVDIPTTTYEAPKVGLMISAITKENWLRAATAGEDVPRVWRVTAVTISSRSSTKDMAPVLLDAAAPEIGKIYSAGSAPAPKPPGTTP